MTAAVQEFLHVTPEDGIRDDLINLLQTSVDQAPRSLQKAIGPSEMGTPCPRRLAYHVLEVPDVPRAEVSQPRLPSFIGTNAHNGLERAALLANQRLGRERYLTELRVEPWPAAMEGCPAELAGSCDLYDTDTATVIDHKVLGDASYKKAKRHGPSVTYRNQVQLYGAGITEMGLPVSRVAIAMWPKAGTEYGLHVWSEPFDPDVSVRLRQRWWDIVARADTLRSALDDPALAASLIEAAPSDDVCRFCPWLAMDPGGPGCPGTRTTTTPC